MLCVCYLLPTGQTVCVTERYQTACILPFLTHKDSRSRKSGERPRGWSLRRFLGDRENGTGPRVHPQGPGYVKHVAACSGRPGGQGRLLPPPRNARRAGPEGKARFGGVCAVG